MEPAPPVDSPDELAVFVVQVVLEEELLIRSGAGGDVRRTTEYDSRAHRGQERIKSIENSVAVAGVQTPVPFPEYAPWIPAPPIQAPTPVRERTPAACRRVDGLPIQPF